MHAHMRCTEFKQEEEKLREHEKALSKRGKKNLTGEREFE
jgi:hypothetical protein